LNTNSSSSINTGAFVVNGGVGIAGNCFVGGNINNVKITQPANSATLTLANNSQLITSGAFSTTFTAVITSNLTLPNTASDTLVGRTTTDTLTNKTLTNPIISAIVNTGTLNLPTITDTLVGRTTTDTLTNKTLTNPTINGSSLSGTFTGASSISSTIFIGDLSGTSLRAGNIAGGSAGQIHYQSATGITLFTASGQVGQVLVSNGTGAPFWITTVNSAGNIAGGSAGQIPYQSATGTTLFTASGQAGQVLVSNGTGAPIWSSNISISGSINSSTNIAGGSAGQIPYQSATGTTLFTPSGQAGQVLVSNGTGAPTWTTTILNATNATNATNVSTTTTTNATTYYLTFTGSNSSTTQSLNVTGSITVNPSTNTISASIFSGTTVTTTSDITINNRGNLILNDSSSTNSTINQDTGILKITNNAPTTLNGNTIFQNKNPSGINIEVLRLNYNNVISQKDLQVNGNINLSGNIFVNNNLLSLTTIFTNNSTNWNSDLLGVSIPSTANYYLIATLGDFNNNANFGSLTIKGSLGGGSGLNTTVIDTTIMTRGNNPTPTINGIIQNYSSSNSTLCDIIIYYTGTSTNTNGYGSNGGNNGAQYYVYIVTNKLGGSRNIYFDLSIKGTGSSANTIYLYNPSTLTTSPTGFSIVPSLLDQLNTLDNNTNTIYSNMGLTVASINRGTNAGIPSIVSGVYTFPVTDGTNNCYLNVNNAGFIPGASYQVSMTCYTVPTSFTNGMYFTLEASGNTTPLYTSPNLSIVSTTYVANIVITTANFLNIHVFVPGGGTTSNSISISNFNVKRIDYYHTGFLGIGTTTPVYNLDVAGTIHATSNVYLDSDLIMRNDRVIYSTNTSGATEAVFWPRMANNATVINCGTGGFFIRSNDSTNRIYMENATGNVGIGTTSPTEKLHVVGNMRVSSSILLDNGGVIYGKNTVSSLEQFLIPRWDNNATYLNYGSGGFFIRNNSTAIQMFFTDGGNIGMGTTTPSVKLEVTGQIKASSFNATSDYRMKENVQPLSVNKTIDNLKPVEYDLSGGTHDMGFLAHEVQEEYPFLIQGEKDGVSMQSLNYNGFIALLVKEVQDLKTNFKTLSLENEMLREKVKSLENKVEILGGK